MCVRVYSWGLKDLDTTEVTEHTCVCVCVCVCVYSFALCFTAGY